MTMHSHKFENIQALRGIAVMLVVFLHLLVVEKKYGHGLILLPQFFNIGAAGVDIFFVISGFIMATVIQGQFQQPNAVSQFLISRFTRIYPLYWFYSLLVLFIFITHPNWVNQSEGGQVNILKSFLLIPQNHLPLLLVGWTLIHEIYFYLIIALFLFLPEKYFSRCLYLWLGLIILINFNKPDMGATLTLITHPLTCEFIMGCYISRLIKINQPKICWFLLTLSIILLCTGFYNYQHTYPNIDIQGWYRVIIYGVPSMLLVYACVSLEKLSLLLPRFLQIIGDASYSIYLGHVLILSALGRIFSLFPITNVFIHLVSFSLMILMVIFCGMISYKYIEKPLIKVCRYNLKFNSNKIGAWINAMRKS